MFKTLMHDECTCRLLLRIAARVSRSRRISSSSKKFATSWAFTLNRRSTPWCSVSTRRVRFRLFNAASLYCPCARAKLRGALMITCAMARPRSSRLWRCYWQCAPPSAIADTALWNSATFWTKSMPLCLKTKRSILSWITMPPTRHRSRVAGWQNGRATTCTLPQHTVRGSIRSSAGCPT